MTQKVQIKIQRGIVRLKESEDLFLELKCLQQRGWAENAELTIRRNHWPYELRQNSLQPVVLLAQNL